MHILFATVGTERKKSNHINGENTRYEDGKGVSGTEQSMIIVAEQLVKNGHKCTITFPKADHLSVYRGVTYLDFFAYWDKPLMTVDMVIITGFIRRFEFIFQKIKLDHIKKFGVWLPCPFFDIKPTVDNICEQIEKNNGNKIDKYVFHVSEWSRNVVGEIPCYKNVTIPNALMSELVKVDETERESNSYIFHACWERGGSVAERVVNKMNGKLYRFDYYENSINLCKLSLFKRMKNIEYFIYPLVLPDGCVHKDTHACVVAEAMANGVIVLTYPIAALKTSYPCNTIAWVDLPRGSNIKSLIGLDKSTTDSTLLSEEAVDNFCNKIKYLESHPEEKEALRKAARKYVLDTFNEDKIGKEFNDSIQ